MITRPVEKHIMAQKLLFQPSLFGGCGQYCRFFNFVYRANETKTYGFGIIPPVVVRYLTAPLAWLGQGWDSSSSVYVRLSLLIDKTLGHLTG